MEPTMPDWMKPSVSKIIIDVMKGEPWCEGRVLVHDKYPNRWREQPYYAWIKSFATHGLMGKPVYFRTFVSIGPRREWVVLPNRDLRYARREP